MVRSTSYIAPAATGFGRIRAVLVAALCVLLVAGLPASAQTATEMDAGSNDTSPIAATAGPVTVVLRNNSNNPTGTTFAAITGTQPSATFTILNQQFATAANLATNGLTIGGELSGNARYDKMTAIGGAQNAQFTSLPMLAAGAGIAVGTNHAIHMEMPTKGLADAKALTTGRIPVADIRIDFNVPVSNPVLHFVGIGGTTLLKGFAVEFDLVPGSSSGATGLARLSGTSSFVVSGNQINHGVTSPGASCSDMNSGSCGSVQVTGSAVTRVYLRAHVRSSEATAWTNSGGDAFMIGVSGEVADMTATLSGAPSSVTAGTLYRKLTLTCTNNGPNFARGTLCLPKASAGEILQLACDTNLPGSVSQAKNRNTVTCTFNYRLPLGGPYPDSIDFLGTTGSDNDRNGGSVAMAGNNYTVIPGWEVFAAAAVSSSKTVSVFSETPTGCDVFPGVPNSAAEVAIPGSCLQYLIRLVNTGTEPAPDLNLTDMLDPRLIFAGARLTGIDETAAGYSFVTPPDQSDCGQSSCAIRIENGILPGQGSAELLVRAVVK
ncbi:hypothetical protein LAZ40_06850 [Cereibacter sphaeroides]|uniref:hypothetical protein n=1 Tax=Cereibacter sphaeroides TaxID=1063 RepID=UPI001F188EBB|nr:hypothetical protein [Cereibacter sphaeroides]MCE6958765.1 hypothetical protein [Cereibacter sphaeroides]MCE6973361.1 hypothetical protein [Cereibacter sphaeroides]